MIERGLFPNCIYRTYYYITATIDIPISIIVSMNQGNIAASGGSQTGVGRTAETHTGTTTSWLSLITSPPPDSRCSHHLYSPDGAYNTLIAFDPRLETAANITCLPQEAAEWYTQKNLPFGATTGIVTSLGPMICPGGYTTASISKKDASSTMVFCCPSHYDFATSADHGHLYGCTSMQTRPVTVHLPGETGSVQTLAAGSPLRAPNIAGIAVNGWLLKPSPAVILPTATLSSDAWAKAHRDMTAGKLLGIIIGALAAILLLFVTLCFFVKKGLCGRKAKSDEEGTPCVDDGTKEPPLSSDRPEPTQTRDVEMSNLDPSGSRVPSAAETVVRHDEHKKSEGSSTDDERIA